MNVNVTVKAKVLFAIWTSNLKAGFIACDKTIRIAEQQKLAKHNEHLNHKSISKREEKKPKI
jgi:hypothetical protein